VTKVVILAGGKGTRLAEETETKPKPMVEVAGRPILWHIMKMYARHGLTDFVVCLGYRGYHIKEYFANYYLHSSDVSFDLATGEATYHRSRAEGWKVTLVDTGAETMTGGRLVRVRDYLDKDEPFCMTYGDGIGDVDISAELEFHRAHGKKCTMSVMQPPGRFGAVTIEGDQVGEFHEKLTTQGAYINGGFFVVHPSALDYVADDTVPWERAPLERLAAEGELMAWRHTGFWQPMDTLRDKQTLEEMSHLFVDPID
jgi:glucose-1-phosphate cytidylyltransferase